MANISHDGQWQQFANLIRLTIGLIAGIGISFGWHSLFVGSRVAPTVVTVPDDLVEEHVTQVSPRVAGGVSRVLVDSKTHIKEGDLLVELDREPYELQVNIQKALLAVAEADLESARAQSLGLIAQVRANRFKLQKAIEGVHEQIANLKANVARLNSQRATLEVAQASLKRIELAAKGVVTDEELSKRREAVQVSEAAVEQALQVVNATRASIGLAAKTADSPNLSEAPTDVFENDSAVRQALGELLQPLTLLGFAPSSWNATPNQVVEEFHNQDATRDLDRIYAKLMEQVPAIKQAQAKQLKARHDLEFAELQLRHCRIVSVMDGVVIHRNVERGNHVEVGQVLLRVRPLPPSR